MSELFNLPRAQAIDDAGASYPGAKLYFYTAGTTTPKDTYTTSALNVANANPVVADAAGRFGAIYLNGSYKVKLTTTAGVEVWTQDNYTTVDLSSISGAASTVSVTVNDTTPQTLSSKLIAGSGVTLTVGNPSGDEELTVASKVALVVSAATAADASITIVSAGGGYTDVLTGIDLGTVTVGEVYLVNYCGNILKGGTAGVTTLAVTQASGTANIIFAGRTITPEAIYSTETDHPAATGVTLGGTPVMRVSDTGTCVLKLQGQSINSDSTIIGANGYQASVDVIKLK